MPKMVHVNINSHIGLSVGLAEDSSGLDAADDAAAELRLVVVLRLDDEEERSTSEMLREAGNNTVKVGYKRSFGT